MLLWVYCAIGLRFRYRISALRSQCGSKLCMKLVASLPMVHQQALGTHQHCSCKRWQMIRKGWLQRSIAQALTRTREGSTAPSRPRHSAHSCCSFLLVGVAAYRPAQPQRA